jgi:hypothetical protein
LAFSSIIREVSKEIDEAGDMLEIEAPPSPAEAKSKRRFFKTPPRRSVRKAKSENMGSFDDTKSGSEGRPSSFRFKSTRNSDEQDVGDGGTSISSSFAALLSPQSEHGVTLSHITSLFHSSFTTLTRGFDGQSSGSIEGSSVEAEETEDDGVL